MNWDSFFFFQKFEELGFDFGNIIEMKFWVCFFICVVVEILENLAFLANASNLVMYLSHYMHFSPSKSANNVTDFMGTAFLLALLGGFLSDAFFTSYHIFLISAAIQLLVIFTLPFPPITSFYCFSLP